MDDIDVAQHRLQGVCEICHNTLNQHKLGCPNLNARQRYRQMDLFNSDEEYWEFEEELINSELDRR